MSTMKDRFYQWLEHFTDKSAKGEQSSDFDSEMNSEVEAQVMLSRKLKSLANQPMADEVPNWNRAEAFDAHQERWWQKTWVNFGSIGVAMASLCVLVLNGEMTVTDEGWSIHFGEKKSLVMTDTQARNLQTSIEYRMDEKLKSFAEEQQWMLANYYERTRDDQKQRNLQFARLLIDQMSEQRSDDLVAIAEYIDQKKTESQKLQSIQYLDLKHRLDRMDEIQKTNYQRDLGEEL